MNKHIFKYGELVVALSSNKTNKQQPRIKGNIYEVEEIQYCCRCGSQLINIGFKGISDNGLFDCVCGNEQENLGLAWTLSREFSKMDNLEEEMLKAADKEDYEFAGLLQGIIKNKEKITQS